MKHSLHLCNREASSSVLSAVDLAHASLKTSRARAEMLDTAALTMFAPGKNGFEELWRVNDIHQGSPGLCLHSSGWPHQH